MMLTPHSLYILISAVLGLGMAIPSNACIVIVNLGSLRKKGKLSPSDVIFMAKGIVNVLLQGVLSVQGMLFALSPSILHTREVYSSLKTLAYFLTYSNFWLTTWLSAHYGTSITNLSCGFFIWLRGVVSNWLSKVLLVTTLGIFTVSAPIIWAVNERDMQSSENGTEASNDSVTYYVIISYLVPATFLGCILPFCLSLLCLVLTFSFLVRHVWRVRNNDSGSKRPNLRAHITALRTIFFLLLTSSSFLISQVILMNVTNSTDPIGVISWSVRSLSPSIEAAVIIQASNKLKRILPGRFWSRS